MKTFQFQKSNNAAITITGATTTWVSDSLLLDQDELNAFAVELKVSAAATEAGDLLSLWVQTSFDGGSTWSDVGRFADVLGNGGAVSRVMQWHGALVTTAEEAIQNKAVAASAVRNGCIGDRLRLAATVTEANANNNAAFTFTVKGIARG